MNTNSSQPSSPNNDKRLPHAYNPITLEDLQRSEPSLATTAFARLGEPIYRCAAAPIFAAVLFYREKLPILVPLPILLLIGCLFWRLDAQARRVAVVPLSLSGIKLFLSITDYLRQASINPGLQLVAFQPGFSWLPLFFSICLVCITRRDSATFKVVLAGSCTLLASGLLPGQGFVSIFLLMEVMLFFAIAVAVFVDLQPYFAVQARPVPSSN
jgi:hypothetical protein